MYFRVLIPNPKSDFRNSCPFSTYSRFSADLLCDCSFFRVLRTLSRVHFRSKEHVSTPQPKGFLLVHYGNDPGRLAGNVRPTDFRKNSFFAFLALFLAFFLVLRQFASQTLIVWGGCRSRPALCCRDLSHFEQMADMAK